MTIVSAKSPGNVIGSTDFNAVVNKIQNGTDNSVIIDSTVPIGGNKPCITLTQNDTSNNPNAITIVQNTTGYNIHSTNNSTTRNVSIIQGNSGTGTGLYVYSNASAAAQPLIYFYQDHVDFNQTMMYLYDEGKNNTCTIGKYGNNVNNTGSVLYLYSDSPSTGAAILQVVGTVNTRQTIASFYNYYTLTTGPAIWISDASTNGNYCALYVESKRRAAYFYGDHANQELVQMNQVNTSNTYPILTLTNAGHGSALNIAQSGTVGSDTPALRVISTGANTLTSYYGAVATIVQVNSSSTIPVLRVLNQSATSYAVEFYNNIYTPTVEADLCRADGRAAYFKCTGNSTYNPGAVVLIETTDATFDDPILWSKNVGTNVSAYLENTGTGSPLRVVPQAVAPTTSLSAGCLYINNSTKKLNIYDGSNWKEVGSMWTTTKALKVSVDIASNTAWTQLISSTANNIYIYAISICTDDSSCAGDISFQIATGAAASEVILIDGQGITLENLQGGWFHGLSVPIKVALGTRVAGRFTAESGGNTHKFTMHYYDGDL